MNTLKSVLRQNLPSAARNGFYQQASQGATSFCPSPGHPWPLSRPKCIWGLGMFSWRAPPRPGPEMHPNWQSVHNERARRLSVFTEWGWGLAQSIVRRRSISFSMYRRASSCSLSRGCTCSSTCGHEQNKHTRVSEWECWQGRWLRLELVSPSGTSWRRRRSICASSPPSRSRRALGRRTRSTARRTCPPRINSSRRSRPNTAANEPPCLQQSAGHGRFGRRSASAARDPTVSGCAPNHPTSGPSHPLDDCLYAVDAIRQTLILQHG